MRWLAIGVAVIILALGIAPQFSLELDYLSQVVQADVAGFLPAAWLPWYWSVPAWFWFLITGMVLLTIPLSIKPRHVA